METCNITKFRDMVERTVEQAIRDFIRTQYPRMPVNQVNAAIREHGKEAIDTAITDMKKRINPWLAGVLADAHGFDLDPAMNETEGFYSQATRFIEEW